MSLSRDAFNSFEDIVGSENISEELVIMDSYAFQWAAEIYRDGSKFMARPEAVLLPGSTREVQAIMRVCNRYKIQCRPFSTGWYAYAAPTHEGEIILDLRRMDRILEIDEKNMFAVVEPHVIGAQLQAEAMKVGLNAHMIGSGCVSSPLAALTSLFGHGPDSIYMGHATENMLGVEWVLPTGDILEVGSLGSGCGWFTSEGPGPSLRGLIRGGIGARGAMGVFTKGAIKLSPWPGPAELPVEGTSPSYYSPLPKIIRAYTIAFPNWEAYADAHYKIYDAEIGYIFHRQFNYFGEDLQAAVLAMFTDPTKVMDDLEELVNRPDIRQHTEELKNSVQIVLAGNTARDIAYQEKALDHILSETGGKKVAWMSEPAMEMFSLLWLIRLSFKGTNMIYGGGYRGSFSQKGTPDFAVSYIQQAAETLKTYQKTGLLADGGGDSMMGPGGGMGGGGNVSFEQFCSYDSADIQSVRGAIDYFKGAAAKAKEMNMPTGYEISVVEQYWTAEQKRQALLGVAQPSMYDWQRKIKDAFDPNGIGDELYLVSPKKST